MLIHREHQPGAVFANALLLFLYAAVISLGVYHAVRYSTHEPEPEPEPVQVVDPTTAEPTACLNLVRLPDGSPDYEVGPCE